MLARHTTNPHGSLKIVQILERFITHRGLRSILPAKCSFLADIIATRCGARCPKTPECAR